MRSGRGDFREVRVPGSPERPDSTASSRGEPAPGRAIGATIAVIVALVVAPILVLAQTGPLRGQGQAEPAAATATAGAGPLGGDLDAASREPASTGADSSQSLTLRATSDSQPSRRPRPDPAPVMLAPTAVVTPGPAPGPSRDRVRERVRTTTREVTERRPSVARVWPVSAGSYEISQPFGCVPQLLGYYPISDGCPVARPSFHNGLDFAATQGTPIYAVASGRVTVAGRDRASGIANSQIVIQHDGANEGYATEYYHWIRTYVEPGDYVQAGELIAEVGSVGYSTGPHLHFSVVEYATNQRIDPVAWLPAGGSGGSYAEADNDRGQNVSANAGGRIVVTDYIDPTPLPVRTAP